LPLSFLSIWFYPLVLPVKNGYVLLGRWMLYLKKANWRLSAVRWNFLKILYNMLYITPLGFIQ